MYTYRKIKPEETNSVVIVHQNTFENFFLTSLGSFFLKTYYKAVIKYKYSIVIGCFNSKNCLVGFAIGTSVSKGFHKKIVINNFLSFLLVGIKLLLNKPSMILRLYKNLTKIKGSGEDENFAELLSIAVDRKERKQGIGLNLLKQFEYINKNDFGVNIIILTTDYYENEAVINFYLSNGYTINSDFIAYPNRRMYSFKKNINK